MVIVGNDDLAALGYNVAYTFDGKDYLMLHGCETVDNALQKLRILRISRDNDWPVIDPADLNKRTTKRLKK